MFMGSGVGVQGLGWAWRLCWRFKSDLMLHLLEGPSTEFVLVVVIVLITTKNLGFLVGSEAVVLSWDFRTSGLGKLYRFSWVR